MNDNELQKLKEKIMKCLTEDFTYGKGTKRPRRNQAIFDPTEGWAVFNNTGLDMVEEKIDLAIKLFKQENGIK